VHFSGAEDGEVRLTTIRGETGCTFFFGGDADQKTRSEEQQNLERSRNSLAESAE